MNQINGDASRRRNFESRFVRKRVQLIGYLTKNPEHNWIRASDTSIFTTPSAVQTASPAVGQQLGELGSEITRKNLSIQPTTKVPGSYRFNVRVNRDILFDAPYTPAEQLVVIVRRNKPQ